MDWLTIPRLMQKERGFFIADKEKSKELKIEQNFHREQEEEIIEEAKENYHSYRIGVIIFIALLLLMVIFLDYNLSNNSIKIVIRLIGIFSILTLWSFAKSKK